MRLFHRARLWPRDIKHFFQTFWRGFSDGDLWDLDVHLAKIILPRLIYFRKQPLMSYPIGLTEDEWLEILDKMIFAFATVVEGPWDVEPSDWDDVQEGLDLFGKWFTHLWD